MILTLSALVIPAFVRKSSLYLRFGPSALRSRFRSAGSIFSEIYRKNRWGGEPGEYYSGNGSRGAAADAYVKFVTRFIQDHKIRSVVDLGCGDMFIGRHIAEACDAYIGIDVVAEIIAVHRQTLGNDRVKFECLDITRETLPRADLCLVRQVFQHLSNAQILAALESMRRNFRYIIVTEHFPSPEAFVRPNVDKAAASSTRVLFGSAVVLDEPPFNIPVEEVLTCRARSEFVGVEDEHGRGMIRSFLIRTEDSSAVREGDLGAG